MPLLLFLTPAVGLAMIARIEEQKWRQRGGRQPRKLPNLRAMPRNKKVDSGTRTPHWPSLRGALATKQSRGRVLWPLDCFAALAMTAEVDPAIIGHRLRVYSIGAP